MTREEFGRLLKRNKKQVEIAAKEFEQHSKEFDKKIRKILLAL